MTDELEEIKRRKLEQLKTKYMNGGKNNMSENMPDKPIHIDDSNIDSTVKKYPVMVVDCWAPWCGPCRMVGPVVEELAKQMKGKVVFGKLNVDENRGISMKYGIMSIPTLLMFKNGKLIDTFIGAMPEPILKAKIESNF
jgi:thioredoxin 1